MQNDHNIGSAHSRERFRRVVQARRRYQFLRAIAIGIATGSLALLFQVSLWGVELARNSLLNWISNHSLLFLIPLFILIIAIGSFVAWFTVRFAPEASGSGIPHIKQVLEEHIQIRWLRLLIVKFVGGVLAIGSGFSLGREGPTVQMGSAVGTAIAKILKSPLRERAHLIACGAGAGLAGAFNAPLAGFIFVIEELRRGLTPMTYGTAFISSLTAALITQLSLGQIPSFHVHEYPMPPLSALPFFLVLGITAGGVGVIFNRSLIKSIQLSNRYLKNAWLRGALVALVVACALWLLPEVSGSGQATAETILKGLIPRNGTITFLLILLVGKILLTCLSFASGVPGGIFAPMLLIGAVLGALVGQLDHLLFPSIAPTVAAFSVVGMAAVVAACVRAPLTAIVLILEMTGNYSQLFPLSVACLFAYLTAAILGSPPIYDALLHLKTDANATPLSPRDATTAS